MLNKKITGRVLGFSDFVDQAKLANESLLYEDGFGTQPFVFKKNGDACSYFFKVMRDEKIRRSLVLTIGKFAKFSQPSDPKQEYGVLSITELKEEELEQAVVDGEFVPNENLIELNDEDSARVFEDLASCVTDYLQKNPKVSKFYDEIQNTLRVTDYETKLKTSLEKWPGDNWHTQPIEDGKTNLITK